jgi:hypothetical protein
MNPPIQLLNLSADLMRCTSKFASDMPSHAVGLGDVQKRGLVLLDRVRQTRPGTHLNFMPSIYGIATALRKCRINDHRMRLPRPAQGPTPLPHRLDHLIDQLFKEDADRALARAWAAKLVGWFQSPQSFLDRTRHCTEAAACSC